VPQPLTIPLRLHNQPIAVREAFFWEDGPERSFESVSLFDVNGVFAIHRTLLFLPRVYFKMQGIVSNVPALKQNKLSRNSDRVTAEP
jgi:hypothetical protein